jgi:alpha-ribazole phosphatase/probable phosphoglycerate mutase
MTEPNAVGDDMTRFVFVRHGSASNVAGRCIGHTNAPLSQEGAAAIRELFRNAAESYDRNTRIISSDLLRAVESAQIISTMTGLPLELDARLREMNFGRWDGRSWSEIERDDAKILHAWMERWSETTTPDGEGARTVLERAIDWINDVATPNNHGRQIITVSHAGWIRAAVTHLTKRDIARMFEIPVDHAHATIIDVATSGNALVASNISSL